MENNSVLMKVLPWILIFGGFYSLVFLPPIIAGSCLVVGITMLIERIWPEKWDSEKGFKEDNKLK